MNANPMQAACGAHCRTTGQPCKIPPMLEKTRCRMHGGKAGRPKTTGQHTKLARQGTKERGELTRLIQNTEQMMAELPSNIPSSTKQLPVV